MEEKFTINNFPRGNPIKTIKKKKIMSNTEEIEQARNILRKNGYLMDALWHIDDVIMFAQGKDITLSNEDAQEIMDNIGNSFDAEIGVNWDVIESNIDYFINN